jgi:hypothetical protein
MSYGVTIWKWKDGHEDIDANEVMDEVAEDNAHPAIETYDVKEFQDALVSEFDIKDDDEDPFQIEIADFTGWSANWMSLSIWFSKVESVMPRIIRLAEDRGLYIFDEN